MLVKKWRNYKYVYGVIDDREGTSLVFFVLDFCVFGMQAVSPIPFLFICCNGTGHKVDC